MIPAHNEGKTIGDVVVRCHRTLPEANILVINDGSTDDTQMKAAGNCFMISHPIAFGKGSAIRSAWLWLTWTQKLSPEDVIIMLDADGQHKPEDIPSLIKELDHYDMVVGKRNLDKYPFHKKFGNRALSMLASMFSGQKIEDGECGFRVLKYKMMYDLLKTVNAQQYEIEMEINIVAGQMGYDIKYVPIDVPFYRSGVKIGGGIKNGWAGFKTWLKIKVGWLAW